MGNVPESNVVSLTVCPGCGADVRSGSEYCFNCGNKLGPAADPIHSATTKSDQGHASENGAVKNGPGVKTAHGRANARSARRSRIEAADPVQVVWKRDDGIGVSFILSTIGAAILVIILIAIAYYLK